VNRQLRRNVDEGELGFAHRTVAFLQAFDFRTFGRFSTGLAYGLRVLKFGTTSSPGETYETDSSIGRYELDTNVCRVNCFVGRQPISYLFAGPLPVEIRLKLLVGRRVSEYSASAAHDFL